MKWNRLIYLLPLCLYAITGCPQPEPCAKSDLVFAVTDQPSDVTPELWALTVADGEVHSVDCRDQTKAGPLACSEQGLVYSGQPKSIQLLVKSVGYRYQQSHHQPSYSEYEPCRDNHQTVPLEPLENFTANDDYRTGFVASSGLADFLEMGYASPTELGQTYVVKFYIEDLESEPQVFFQNTRRHPIHYSFVRNVLGRTFTLREFEERTYHGLDRQAMAGSIVYYPDISVSSQVLGQTATSPLVVEFFPSDDLTPEQAATAYLLLQQRLLFAPLHGQTNRLFYSPAGSTQEEQLLQDRQSFLHRGALWLLNQELYADISLQLLNPGVGYGTLRLMTPEQLGQSVVSFQDILLLKRLPNQLPIVGGTITEELQTPLAHVNVAARSRGTPNIALLQASSEPEIQPLLGQLVRFEVTPGGYTLETTTLAEAQEFWQNRGQQDPLVPEFDLEVEGLVAFSDIAFQDSRAVGVKAANVAVLSQLLPDNTPHGFAVPFVYYDTFMKTNWVTAGLCGAAFDDCVFEGRQPSTCQRALALCAYNKNGRESFLQYAHRLIEEPSFVSNSTTREAALDGLRHMIRNTPLDNQLARQLDSLVTAEFGSDKVRLRSSTNAEDLPRFSGAGLYNSVSAYGSGDKSASQRIRRVWASVWNWRAFEERSFWAVEHKAVRMGVLVHQAFPDEQANGVLVSQNLADPAARGIYVNVQKGEVSVTNPEDGALPEVFSIIAGPDSLQIARQRYSSLSSNRPLLTQEEISDLYRQASQIQRHYAQLYGEDPMTMTLEMEFKIHGPQRDLIFKQVRPYYAANSQ